MEERMFLGGLAVAFAFGCFYAVARVLMLSVLKRRTVLAAQGQPMSMRGLVRWRLQNGYACFVSLARLLSSLKWVGSSIDEIVIICEPRGIMATRQSLISVALLGLVLLALCVYIVTRSILGAIAVDLCALALAYVVLGNLRDKRQEAVREAVPGVLESMEACFGSGFTLLQTFEQVSQETPGYLGATFSRSAHVLETGGSASQALRELREGIHARDLVFVALALEIQHQSGGSMRQVLAAARDSVKSELALRRSLRVQTAQAKLSARIVVLMPFLLVALFSLASPDFLAPFFSSIAGYVLLAVALVMQIAGVVLVHRALAVDGVS